jgi:hypothetical protein
MKKVLLSLFAVFALLAALLWVFDLSLKRGKEERSLLAFLWRFCLHVLQKPLSGEEMNRQRENIRQNL